VNNRKLKIILFFLSVLVLTLLIFSYSNYYSKRSKSNHSYNSLNDFGGIGMWTIIPQNFTQEIYIGTNEKNPILPVAKLQNNSVLRWGIKRAKNNGLPSPDPGAAELISKYRGVYIGDTDSKKIYLTFDEGYENGYTPQILDVLKNNNCKAIFFVTGPYLKQYPDLVMRMIEEGHYVGNHTIHHPSLPSLSDNQIEEELSGLERYFREKFNKNMIFMRPPRGEYNPRVLEIADRLGYCTLFWSFAYDDWYKDKIRGAQYAHDIVMSNIHNGAVLLLHAVSKDNADALDSIIKDAIAAGYEIGDPYELIPGEDDD